MDETNEVVAFEWAVQPSTAEGLRGLLGSLGVQVTRSPAEPARDANERVYAMLEGAGLTFDQQQYSQLSDGASELLSGAASVETLSDALFRFSEGRGAGGLVVDVLASPAQVIEVRHISGEILVLADAEGARQLPVSPDSIASALRRSLAARSA